MVLLPELWGDGRMKCDYCYDKDAKYTETCWGIKHWCADCEEEAAWDIYNDLVEEVGGDE